MAQGKMTVHIGGDYVVTEDKKSAALDLFQRGYKIFETRQHNGATELLWQVAPEKVQEDKDYRVMPQLSGG